MAKIIRPLIAASTLLIAILSLNSCTSTPDSTEENKGLPELPVQTAGKKMEPITGSDGQVYPTIAIGQQVWMAENLRKTTFDCEDNIHVQFTNGLERGPGVKFYDGKPRYAFYENSEERGFGVIYSFSVLQNCPLCPPGFRIPTKTDWEILVSELGGKSVAGKELLQSGGSGFNAEIGGRIDGYGSVLAGRFGFWWSSDLIPPQRGVSKVYTFEVSSIGVLKIKGQDIRVGNYVRCIKE